MRLISLAFMLLAALAAGAQQAHAQEDGYAPPPVDFVDPGDMPASGVAPPGEPIAIAAGPRRLRVDLGAYVEVEAGASGELAGGNGFDDEVLTYTSVAAGVEGQVSTRRVTAGFSYRYERRFELNGDLPDEDIHSGIASARAEIAPGLLSVEAGGLATRTGGSGRAFGVTDREDSAEIYAGYAGPTLTTRAGPVDINAFYRLGYVKVDDDSLAGPGFTEGSFDTTVHLAGASAGVAPGGVGRPGFTVSAGHMIASTSTFDSEFDSQFVRGDVVLPVSPTFAVSGGVGYSRARAAERDVLRDGNGVPVFDGDGNLRPDPNGPMVTTLDSDGVYADAGFVWRPTPRAELQLRAGVTDDGEPTVLGSASFQVGRNVGFSVSLYDNDETFGTSLTRNLRNLPEDFEITRDPFTGGLATGCAFSKDTPGRGVCLSPSLQSLTRASFRERGGAVLFSGTGRTWSYGGGVTYLRRDTYLPDDPIFADAFAPDEQDLALFASASRPLGHFADIGFDGFVSFFDSEAPGRDVTTIGGRVDFTRSFLFRRLQLLTALGLTYRSLFGDDSLVAEAILGLRYTF